MTGWRTALRLAWREAKRAKGRSILILAMITLPVMTMAFAVVGYETFELSPAEKANRQMGTAQAVASWFYEGPVKQEPDYLRAHTDAGQTAATAVPADERLLALFPAGTRAIRAWEGSLTVHTATGIGSLGTRVMDYADPLAHGIHRQLSGRAPAAADEIALTQAASARLSAGVDGTVRIANSDKVLRVTAIVEDPTNLDVAAIVMRPGAFAPPAERQNMIWLVATPNPLSWADVKQLNTHGVTAISRQVLAGMPDASERYQLGITRGDIVSAGLLLVAGVAILEVVLLAGAAFAVGARRRKRDLALVAASGGTPAHVRRMVIADGFVHGVLAAGIGIVLGVASAALAVPFIENFVRARAGGLLVSALPLVILGGVAVVTGMLASLIPAWTSARQDVVAALAGRRGITRSRRRWLVMGLVLTGIGVAVSVYGAWQTDTTIILIGLIVTALAIALCTPALIGLVARVGRWLPPPARIALRDTSRNRTAAAPAIAAVMAAVIGTLVIGIVTGSQREHAQLTTSMRPGDVFVYVPKRGPADWTQVAATLRGTMPVDQTYEIRMTTWCGQDCLVQPRIPADRACPYLEYILGRQPTQDEQRAAIDDPRCSGVRAENRYFDSLSISGTGLSLTVVIPEAAAGAVSGIPDEDVPVVTSALRDGKVVVDDPRMVDNGFVTLVVEKFGVPEPNPPSVRAAAFALPNRPRAGITMMTEATARSLGFDTAPFGLLATTTRMPTVAESDRLEAELGNEFNHTVQRDADENSDTLILLAIVAAVITLGSTALVTGLAAADGRADLSTLAAVGASPGLRRILSLSQSGVIAGLGSLLGAIVGVGAALIVLWALNQGTATTWPTPPPYPITIPWLNLAIAVLAVPLVAMLGAGLVTRSRLPIEHRL